MELSEYYQIVNKALKGDKEAQKKWGECQAEMIPKHIEAHSGGKAAKAEAEKAKKAEAEKAKKVAEKAEKAEKAKKAKVEKEAKAKKEVKEDEK